MARKEAEYLNPSTSRPVAVRNKESVARLELLKGGVTLSHSHPVEVMVVGVSGVWRIYLGERSITLGEDQVLRLPAYAEHRAEALTDALALTISASSSAHCCSAIVHGQPKAPYPSDSVQDPDQYLWGV